MTLAARQHPSLTWVVANADRRLPLGDACVDLLLSMHGRRNPEQCARVLHPGGALILVVPAAHDLSELRVAIDGRASGESRVASVLGEFGDRFTLVRRSTIEERHHLDAGALRQLLRATYRGERRSATTRADALDALDVTLASDLLVFQRS
jgi:23S rRNA (guanine745-N1)-methyltransferase